MVTDAVAHRFDEDGLAAAAAIVEGALARGKRGSPHGEDVVAVDADRVDAVADAARGDPVAAILFERRCRDGVPVVPADEDDRAAAGGGDVEGGVEVAF